MKDKKNVNALTINKIRCILAIVVCSLLCVLVFFAVTNQLLSNPNELVEEVGWKTYHMFTILSNILMAVSAAMCIPFAVDGLRFRNYHLPRWYVNLMFMGTTGVAITFVIALTVLSPATGFYRMMIHSNNLFFHTICPILSIGLFFFINSDHRIRWKSSIIAIIPVVLYSFVYLVMVFIIGEESGGWRDHYQIERITEYLPVPVVMLLLVLWVLNVIQNGLFNKFFFSERITFNA